MGTFISFSFNKMNNCHVVLCTIAMVENEKHTHRGKEM